MERKYMVARGKSVLTRKGIISEGEVITVKILGSPSIFEDLKKKEVIVEFAPRVDYQHVVDLRKPRREISMTRASRNEIQSSSLNPEVKIIEVGNPDMLGEKPKKRAYTRKKVLFDEPAEKKETEEETEEEIEQFPDMPEEI